MPSSRRLFLLFTLHSSLFTLLAGCAHAPLSARYAGPTPLPPEAAAYYSYPSKPTQVRISPIREQRQFREWLVQFPLSAQGFESTEPMVEFEWFQSRAAGRRPAILFNPILGGDYPLERGMCRFFAAHGFHVALIHRKTLKISPEHSVDRLELLLRQGVLRIRQVVDWMEQRDEVDPHRMGSFGISMGGIAGVISAAVEPRLRVHVVALAGGGLPEILATSKDRLLAKPRAKYLAYNHLTPAQLEAQLRERIRTDPVRLAPYVDATSLLLFIAVADRTIGLGNALRLRRALGRPATIFLPFGHYTTYLAIPYLRYESLRFFRRHLVDGAPREMQSISGTESWKSPARFLRAVSALALPPRRWV